MRLQTKSKSFRIHCQVLRRKKKKCQALKFCCENDFQNASKTLGIFKVLVSFRCLTHNIYSLCIDVARGFSSRSSRLHSQHYLCTLTVGSSLNTQQTPSVQENDTAHTCDVYAYGLKTVRVKRCFLHTCLMLRYCDVARRSKSQRTVKAAQNGATLKFSTSGMSMYILRKFQSTFFHLCSNFPHHWKKHFSVEITMHLQPVIV